jgi:hypothetical protein
MPQMTRSQRFVQKAEAALLSALEIYNKPNFLYREETFAILALNAWELVLKAKLLHEHGNDPRALWVYETRQTKKGQPIKKRFRRRNRSGHVQTLSLGQVLVQLEKRGVSIPAGIRRNLDALIEIRDNAAHYILAGPLLGKQVLEIGTASVANFLNLARDWFGRDLSRHHLYLMPLGFAAPPKKAGIVVTKDEQKLVEYLMSLMKASDVGPNDPYQIALALNIRLKRSSADTAIKVPVTDDPEATKVILTEEDFKATYPWDYGDLMREESGTWTSK